VDFVTELFASEGAVRQVDDGAEGH